MSAGMLRPVEQVLLEELTLIVARIEALTLEEAQQAYQRLGTYTWPPTQPGQVDRVALTNLGHLIRERMQRG